MRVNSFINTTLYYSPKFKGKEDEFKDSNDGWNVICEDPSTAEVRKLLREDYEKNVLPYSFLYSKHTDKPSKIEQALINDDYRSFVRYRKPVKLKDYKNSYKGVSLENYPETLKELKDKGIKTVISLDPIFNGYDEENTEMKYLYIDINDFEEDAYDEDAGFDYDAFADIISCMKKGNFYIGCILGTDQTTRFLDIADYFVHPNHRNIGGAIIPVIPYVETIIEEMNPEQKERMGLTEEDEKLIKQRIDDEWSIVRSMDKYFDELGEPIQDNK